MIHYCPKVIGLVVMGLCQPCVCRVPAPAMAVCSHTSKVMMVEQLVASSSWQLQLSTRLQAGDCSLARLASAVLPLLWHPPTQKTMQKVSAVLP